ncbi:hypothetical protein BPLS_P1336 [Bathymodiolus platifrons methanotrophic gill symbiont]|uniref:hypothetical protein n=1 Tax=Bathymodiolus platifrons methanotrophic gill symbiont TaxID=113268 RepID=UPI001B587C6C|nr:hypothetical protein [Bathymodiolus platifrons methanotrophic gill symbiont]GFO74561.1 hypothetical protein BPLS_P1336 [Bathymodiolus platifrons methanotrophic gill symbiont]
MKRSNRGIINCAVKFSYEFITEQEPTAPPYSLKTGRDNLFIHTQTIYLSPFPANTGISLQRYDAERIKAAIDYLQANYQEVHAAGLGNFKAVNRKLDTRALGYFLKRFGLKHESVGKNLAGNYQITEDSLIQIRAINKRRKAKKSVS